MLYLQYRGLQLQQDMASLLLLGQETPLFESELRLEGQFFQMKKPVLKYAQNGEPP